MVRTPGRQAGGFRTPVWPGWGGSGPRVARLAGSEPPVGTIRMPTGGRGFQTLGCAGWKDSGPLGHPSWGQGVQNLGMCRLEGLRTPGTPRLEGSAPLGCTSWVTLEPPGVPRLEELRMPRMAQLGGSGPPGRADMLLLLPHGWTQLAQRDSRTFAE
uniref:Uncharacterized protein n=1 Tax=Taeniopygia guttata TaxID=59729 RepID=A0A674GJQ6_TAEGU